MNRTKNTKLNSLKAKELLLEIDVLRKKLDEIEKGILVKNLQRFSMENN